MVKKNLVKIIVIAIVVVAIVLAAFFVLSEGAAIGGRSKVEIKVGQATVTAEVVSSQIDTTRGLSGRKSLASNAGMLFDFGDYELRSFWMKDMNFPLDIIWISGGKIVGVERNVLPEGVLPQTKYISPGPVNQVLEVNGNWMRDNQVMVGDVVTIN